MDWICDVYAIMKSNKIKQKDVASKLGITEEYLSAVFNRKRAPKKAEEKVRAAVDEIISERLTKGV